MQQQPEISVVFKCGANPDENVVCKATETIVDAKCRLLRAWPIKYPRARVPGDLRIIFCGKELKDEELLSDLLGRSKTEKLVLHLIVRDRNPGSPGSPAATPTVHYAGSPAVRVRPGPLLTNEATQAAADASANVESVAAASGTDQAPPSPSNVEEAEAHFHAVTVSERELTEFRMIFDKKKGADGLIALATVRMVLQSYWRFIHREGFEANVRPFPEERLEQLRRKVDASNGLTLEQFLTVFYLFDNVASEEPCVHGERERVRVATAQLHSVLQPSHEFYHEKFEQIFGLVCGDENQHVLTCKEMELLYYMYSAFVLEKVREEECVTKVQAIVRMRLQSSKYTKLVDAARTLQNVWRMRMFSADRNNHERIAEFLRSLMSGPDHKGGSGGGPRV